MHGMRRGTGGRFGSPEQGTSNRPRPGGPRRGRTARAKRAAPARQPEPGRPGTPAARAPRKAGPGHRRSSARGPSRRFDAARTARPAPARSAVRARVHTLRLVNWIPRRGLVPWAGEGRGKGIVSGKSVVATGKQVCGDYWLDIDSPLKSAEIALYSELLTAISVHRWDDIEKLLAALKDMSLI